METLSVPLDTPTISFKNEKQLFNHCFAYLSSLGIDKKTIRTAFRDAVNEQASFAQQIKQADEEILQRSRQAGRITLLLAGRPYHADPLIQHKLAEMITSMGADVITDDIVRNEAIPTADTHYVAQWAYPNRILRAAKWAAQQGNEIQLEETTPFACGTDDLLTE